MKHPYPTPRAGSANYYFRRKVPLELHAILQKTETWLSLETPSWADAAARLPAAVTAYQRVIAAAQAQAAVTAPASET